MDGEIQRDRAETVQTIELLIQTTEYNLSALRSELARVRSGAIEDEIGFYQAKAYALSYAGIDLEALASLNALVAVEPNWFSVYRLAVTHFRLGDYKSALEAVDWSLDLMPDFHANLILKASILMALGDAGGAAEMAEKAISAGGDLKSRAILNAARKAQGTATGEADELVSVSRSLFNNTGADSDVALMSLFMARMEMATFKGLEE